MAEGVARLPLRGSRSVCTCQHHETWCWLRQAPNLLFFFYKTYPHIKDDYASSERPMRQKGWPEDRWRFWIAYGGGWWQNQQHRFVVQYNRKNAAFWKWAFLQQVKRAIVLPPHTVKTRGGRSSRTLVLPSQAVKTGRGHPEITCHICPLHV